MLQLEVSAFMLLTADCRNSLDNMQTNKITDSWGENS